MGNIKDNNVKNHAYYFFNCMINIKDFDSSLIKIDKKPYKNIGIHNTGNITTKRIDDYENINIVNPLYLIIVKGNGYIQENNGSKYLVFISTDANKKVLAKFTKLWDEIAHLIETINEGKRVSMKKISWKSNLIQMTTFLQIKC